MADKQFPDNSEVQSFLTGLKEYRTSLSETHQALLDAMVAAAMGKKAEEEEEEDIKPYWVAYAAPVVAVAPMPVVPVAPVYAAPVIAPMPWGAAYGVRVW